MKARISDYFKKAWQCIVEFKITMLMTVLWTVFLNAWIIIDMQNYSEKSIMHSIGKYSLAISSVIILTALAAFISEICFHNDYSKYIFICVPAALLTSICVYITTWNHPILNISENRAQSVIIGYVLLMVLAIIYFSFRKCVREFYAYILVAFSYLVTAFAIWMVLYLGLSAIYAVVDSLIFEIKFEWEAVILVISVGFCLIPFGIFALTAAGASTGNDDGNESFDNIYNPIAKFVIKYLVTGISIVIMFVGYVYIVKIAILRVIPSNEIFPIVASLFVVGAPVWLIDENYYDDSLYSRIVRLLPYFLVPLICLQVWSLYLRVHEYSFTSDRYLGIVLIIFEISFVVVWNLYRHKSEILLLIAGLIVAVAFIFPFVNKDYIPLSCQQYYAEKYAAMLADGMELTTKEYSRFTGAYRYLLRNGNKDAAYYEAKYERYLDDEAYVDTKKEVNHSVHGCKMVGTLDMSGYRTFNMLDQDEKYSGRYDGKSDMEIPDFSRFCFVKRGSAETVIVDLSDIFDKVVKLKAEDRFSDEEKDSEYLKKFNRIQIDSNTVFYLNHFELSYETVDDEIISVWNINISGMLVEK